MNAAILFTHVLLPGTIAGLAWLIAWLPWRRANVEQPPSAVERWVTTLIGALGTAGAFAACFLIAEGWPGLPPRALWQWSFLIVATAGGIGALAAIWGRWRGGGLITAVLLGIAGGAMFMPLQSVESPVLWKFGIGAVVFALMAALSASRPLSRSIVGSVALWTALTSAAIVLIQARFLKLGLLAATLAVIAGAVVVTRLVVRRADMQHGVLAVASAALVVLLALGYFYDERGLSPWCFALPVVGLLLLPITALPPLRRRTALAIALAWVLAIVFPAIAVALTMSGSKEAPSTYDPYAY